MKNSYLTLMLFLFLFSYSSGIQAQNKQIKLDQPELLNKLLGTWQAEIGKDSIQIQEYKSFGNAIECNIKNICNNKILYSLKQLWGYDKINDKIIGLEIGTSSSEFNLYLCRFSSNSILEGTVIQDVYHTENVTSKIKLEFKSPDLFILYSFTDASGVLAQKYTRIKK
jgi:hypothetical protein